MSSSLHPQLRAEVFANNDLCTFCWPHPRSLPAQLAPDTGGREQGPAGRERGRTEREALRLSCPAWTEEGLGREVRCLGSPL